MRVKRSRIVYLLVKNELRSMSAVILLLVVLEATGLAAIYNGSRSPLYLLLLFLYTSIFPIAVSLHTLYQCINSGREAFAMLAYRLFRREDALNLYPYLGYRDTLELILAARSATTAILFAPFVVAFASAYAGLHAPILLASLDASLLLALLMHLYHALVGLIGLRSRPAGIAAASIIFAVHVASIASFFTNPLSARLLPPLSLAYAAIADPLGLIASTLYTGLILSATMLLSSREPGVKPLDILEAREARGEPARQRPVRVYSVETLVDGLLSRGAKILSTFVALYPGALALPALMTGMSVSDYAVFASTDAPIAALAEIALLDLSAIILAALSRLIIASGLDHGSLASLLVARFSRISSKPLIAAIAAYAVLAIATGDIHAALSAITVSVALLAMLATPRRYVEGILKAYQEGYLRIIPPPAVPPSEPAAEIELQRTLRSKMHMLGGIVSVVWFFAVNAMAFAASYAYLLAIGLERSIAALLAFTGIAVVLAILAHLLARIFSRLAVKTV